MTAKTVEALNEFLKGRYMGIHQYEQYIAHTKDPRLKKELQQLQLETKHQAEAVARRIQQLGGTAVDGVGLIGNVQEAFKDLKGYPEASDDILRDLLAAEKKFALDKSHAIIRGDLDPESARMIDEILFQDQDHARRLAKLLQDLLPVGAGNGAGNPSAT